MKNPALIPGEAPEEVRYLGVGSIRKPPLYPLDARHFDVDPSIENKTDVDNPTENRHGISGYLGDPVVAKRIYRP